nr:MAG TPA: hypothetical protein [Caudoviricetes sp.]
MKINYQQYCQIFAALSTKEYPDMLDAFFLHLAVSGKRQ